MKNNIIVKQTFNTISISTRAGHFAMQKVYILNFQYGTLIISYRYTLRAIITILNIDSTVDL